MESTTKPPVLDYAGPERGGAVWPCPLLMVMGVMGVLLAPSVGCACGRGEYKMGLAFLGSGGLFVRAVVALVLRERGWGWIPYLLFAVLSLLAGSWVVDRLF